jgi:hypothetical protein
MMNYNASLLDRLPLLVRQQLQCSYYLTAVVCWLLLLSSPLAPKRNERTLGADMYVMF